MKRVLIIESPNKAKTISQYLSGEFVVFATCGHIKDLPKNEIGVELNGDVRIRYVVIGKKRSVVKRMRDIARGAMVLIGTDPDREGESIAYDVADVLGIDPRTPCRVEFHEVTAAAIRKALQKPRPIDLNLVLSQRARRVIDRLVGYKVSPVLWQNIQSGTSAGRVQSVALRLIVDREREIRNFKSVKYFIALVQLSAGDRKLTIELSDEKGEVLKFDSVEKAAKAATFARTCGWQVNDVKRDMVSKLPPPALITSTMQQSAGKLFGWKPDFTMKVAQELFEGGDTPDGRHGIITYIRTDSCRIGDDALRDIQSVIANKFGGDFVNKNKFQRHSGKYSQGAHEAIRPASAQLTPEQLRRSLTPEQSMLYTLIWRRGVASLMSPAIVEETVVSCDALRPYEGNHIGGRVKGSKLVFEGFMALLGTPSYKAISQFKKDEDLICDIAQPLERNTQPPERYSASSLIKALEQRGIGRPSTYATIIKTLFDRSYVTEKKGILCPSHLGERVVAFLVSRYVTVMDEKFTAKMEEELDVVHSGRRRWKDVVIEFAHSSGV